MKLYRIPGWLKWFYPNAIWDFSKTGDKTLYLTFDDGPNPEITDYLLDLLDQYGAKATFFCLGEQVQAHPELFQKIIDKGHQIGNHSMTHPNGWWTANKKYIADIEEAAKYIPSKLFRPPYGRVSLKQYKSLQKLGYKIVFWTVVSYDFDPAERKKRFIKRMKRYTVPGAIFVFHDNPKALAILKNELPKLMKKWKKAGFEFKKIEM